MGQQLAPLFTWHQAWLQQHAQQTQQAREWWNSPDRRAFTAEACMGKATAAAAVAASQPAAAAAGGGAASPGSGIHNSSSSSSSSGEEHAWKAGCYDFHAKCPLCQDEVKQQQQRQQQQQQHSSSSCSEAVPHTNLFMWRRLLWQLLGKLSPESQAFYAQYLVVCPHCSSRK
jgi:hypothetical protein